MGLVLQLFELREIFVQKKMARFYAQGLCMYPCIKPGDVLEIEPRDIKAIEIGDIVVFRKGNALFSHRAIEKKDDYIITRPDASILGSDGPVNTKDILGVVSRIKRRNAFWHFLRPRILQAAIKAITFTQQLEAYRGLAKFVFSKLNKKIDFSLRIPLNANKPDWLERVIPESEFSTLSLAEFPAGKIVLNINSRPAAYLTFSGRKIAGLNTRIRYRGTGIEERLRCKAGDLLKI